MDKEFIDDIAINKKTKEESFRLHFPDLCVEGKDIATLADRRFKRKDNLEYYNAILDEVREKEEDLIDWTRQDSLRDLIFIKEKLKTDLENGKRTQAIIMGYIQSIKEMNLMQGFNEVNINSKSESIKIIGFNYLKGVDESGKIVDVENSEVKNLDEPKENKEETEDNKLQEL